MSVKNLLRKLTPFSVLEWNRMRKKKAVKEALLKQKNSGDLITKELLIQDFRALGVVEGDVVLVHSSLSKMGYLEHGAKTFVDALTVLIGTTGTILMPTSPNGEYQLDFIKKNPIFDVKNSPSKTGAITEYFRNQDGVLRSIHPTEPVAALGNDANWFVKDHFNQITPYTSKSPFYRVSERKGKLIYVGVTLDNAGTNLHTLEDAVDFKFPVYYDQDFEVETIDYEGFKKAMKTKVHNPVYSKKRKCDQLIPHFRQAGILSQGKIGNADTLVFEAKGFLETMIKLYNKAGVTMYTPNGSN